MNDLDAFAKLVQALDPWRGQLIYDSSIQHPASSNLRICLCSAPETETCPKALASSAFPAVICVPRY